jgi:hypothetical protein
MQELMICWEAGVWLFYKDIRPIVIFLLFILHSVLHTLLSIPSLSFHFLPLIFLLDTDCSNPTRGAILIENEDQKFVLSTET